MKFFETAQKIISVKKIPWKNGKKTDDLQGLHDRPHTFSINKYNTSTNFIDHS